MNMRNLPAFGILSALGISVAWTSPLTAQAVPAAETAASKPVELVSFNYMTVYRRAAQLGLLSQDIAYTVTVAPDGTATDCDIEREYRSPLTAKELCRAIMRSGEFSPARDEAGQTTSGTFTAAIRYWSPFAASR